MEDLIFWALATESCLLWKRGTGLTFSCLTSPDVIEIWNGTLLIYFIQSTIAVSFEIKFKFIWFFAYLFSIGSHLIKQTHTVILP